MDFLKDLVHSFIPRAENGYKPYFFRARAVVITAALVLLLGAVAFTLQTLILKNNSYLAAVIASVLVDLANGDRAQSGLAHLTMSPLLTTAAQLKAADMARKGYFAHMSPEGVTPWFWFQEAGYAFTYAGENLAVRFTDSAAVNEAWMNSPTHRANILSPQFTEIGIATAQGVYQGQSVIFVVQTFGRRAAKPEPATPIAAAPAARAAVTEAPIATASPNSASGAPVFQDESVSESATATSVAVAGAAAEPPKVIFEDESFVAVEAPPAEATPAAAAASRPFASFTSFFEKVLTSPRTLMHIVYVALAALILVALTLMIVLEVRRQHPLNVLYGIGLLLLIVGVLYVGQRYVGGVLALV